jgi:hypothetical protein
VRRGEANRHKCLGKLLKMAGAKKAFICYDWAVRFVGGWWNDDGLDELVPVLGGLGCSLAGVRDSASSPPW